MYLHLMDPHAPYDPPAPYDSMFGGTGSGRHQEDTRLYEGEIRYVDAQLEVLFKAFERLGIADKTLFVITSDHGEAFGEHGDWGHDHTVYQEQIHVPLILRYARERWAGEVVESTVRSLDIAPTILDYAGIEVPGVMAGQSLRRAFEDSRDLDVFIDHYSARDDHRLTAIVAEGRYKYIRTLKSELRDIDREGDEELYDLREDPAEIDNLASQRPDLVRSLRSRLQEHERDSARALGKPPPLQLDAKTSEQLRVLGYID